MDSAGRSWSIAAIACMQGQHCHRAGADPGYFGTGSALAADGPLAGTFAVAFHLIYMQVEHTASPVNWIPLVIGIILSLTFIVGHARSPGERASDCPLGQA